MPVEDSVDLSGDGGVLKKLIKEGTGEEFPSTGCTVSVHYAGRLTDGTPFDSSYDRNEPFSFQVGVGMVTKGFDLGCASMKLGEICEITCTAPYSYGEAGSPPTIPPNATLIFKLEMLGWKGEDVSILKDGGIEKFILKKADKRRTPKEGARVNIHLEGSFESRVFEDRDCEFDMGEGSEQDVVEGVEIALQRISVGEQSKLILKPKYAFGSEGNAKFNIPPNATVEYKVTLNKCEMAPEAWKLDSEENIEQAKIYKEKGTGYLKQEKYKLALKMYERSYGFVNTLETPEAKDIKKALYLNKSLCNLKLKDYYATETECNKALEIEPNNVKALYRRGQSYYSRGDYEQSLVDFKRIKELEPENKAAQNQMALCNQQIRAYEQKQKSLYANMFSKFAEIDKAKEKSEKKDEPDVLSSCGEWTPEEAEAKREVDKAFEMDDNIVMLDNMKILTGRNKAISVDENLQLPSSNVSFLGSGNDGDVVLDSSVYTPSAPPLFLPNGAEYSSYKEVLEAEPPEWLPDSSTTVCMQCNAVFTALTRGRHHCRFCGGIFCRICTKGRCLLPVRFRERNPQRVCDSCYDRLDPLQGVLINTISNAVQSAKHDVMDWTSARGWLNLPIGLSMEHEIYKASNTLRNYCQVAKSNPEKSIPLSVLKSAQGLAILTVIKAGALVSYKLGTGLVVARRHDGSWSAPSAIFSLGLGWGAQIGGELMDFIVVLHDTKAVKTFCSRMHFSLGAGCSVAAGPIGRVAEADLRAGDRGSGMCYTYSCSKGAFVGVSLEGNIVATRMDANLRFYGDPYLTTSDILLGLVDRPKAAQPLYTSLQDLYSSLRY